LVDLLIGLVIESIGESLGALEERCGKNALLLLFILLLKLCFFHYTISFKGKEIKITRVFRDHIKRNDETS
jgi:hypothetical protein